MVAQRLSFCVSGVLHVHTARTRALSSLPRYYAALATTLYAYRYRGGISCNSHILSSKVSRVFLKAIGMTMSLALEGRGVNDFADPRLGLTDIERAGGQPCGQPTSEAVALVEE